MLERRRDGTFMADEVTTGCMIRWADSRRLMVMLGLDWNGMEWDGVKYRPAFLAGDGMGT